MNDRISIHISTRDRWSELGFLLQSLLIQGFKLWDLFILDDASGNPITNCYFINHLLNKIKMENHIVSIRRNDISFGVCYARNELIKHDFTENRFILRLDDDVILSRDYLGCLFRHMLNDRADMVSGLTPPLGVPPVERNLDFAPKIFNEIEFDKEGNLTKLGDDCGFFYQPKTFPANHLRSCFLYKRGIHDKLKYPDNLTKVGFREETNFCLNAAWNGWNKFIVDTSAIAWHFQCPSGGCRQADYSDCIKLDDETFRKWAKDMFLKNGEPFGTE